MDDRVGLSHNYNGIFIGMPVFSIRHNCIKFVEPLARINIVLTTYMKILETLNSTIHVATITT
jgi:hypothetical protein